MNSWIYSLFNSLHLANIEIQINPEGKIQSQLIILILSTLYEYSKSKKMDNTAITA